MAVAADIVKKAASFIGTKESPAKSNNVIFNTHYYGKQVSGNFPWCCVFVWDIFRLCSASDLFYSGKKTAYCPDLQVWAKENNLVRNKTDGRPGDIILFDWNGNMLADHVGIIEKKNADGTYTTIEGNTSLSSNDNGGCVMRRVRALSEVLSVIRPEYGNAVMQTYKNKTGKALAVYADTLLRTQIGTLNKDATCRSFGLWDETAVLLYKVNSTGAYKIGFTDRTEGLL
ncbi:MAG: CHAP domain-containing protein [Clostridia bacterium]|nr:CHAP domain-containing protein [Clostridia bacterium]